MKPGSLIITCPICHTPHLATAAQRVLGGWMIHCRICGRIPWRAV